MVLVREHDKHVRSLNSRCSEGITRGFPPGGAVPWLLLPPPPPPQAAPRPSQQLTGHRRGRERDMGRARGGGQRENQQRQDYS